MSMGDKIEIVGYERDGFLHYPIYREKDTGTMGNTDTMALLTRMVNEFKEENEMLKKSFFENLIKPKSPYVDLNALWKDGYTLEEYLKMKEIPEKYIVTPKKTATSSLGKQVGDIEAGKVVER
jgi:hypothetical protein